MPKTSKNDETVTFGHLHEWVVVQGKGIIVSQPAPQTGEGSHASPTNRGNCFLICKHPQEPETYLWDYRAQELIDYQDPVDALLRAGYTTESLKGKKQRFVREITDGLSNNARDGRMNHEKARAADPGKPTDYKPIKVESTQEEEAIPL